MRSVATAVFLVLILLPVVPFAQVPSKPQHGLGRPLPVGGAVPRASLSEQSQYTLPPGYYYPFRVTSHGGGTQLKFSVRATAAVDIYVMTSLQYAGFTSFGTRSSIYHTASATLTDAVALPSKGDYYLLIDNDLSGAEVSLDVAYRTVPVDIYLFHASPPAPTGIVDYGMQNVSGNLLPYSQAISSLTGSGMLTSVQAFNASSPTGASPYGASLQLNVMLSVNTTTSQHVYWLQDVLSLYTNNETAYFVDNIWNASEPNGILDPGLVSGSGSVYPATKQNYYAAAGNTFSYSAPLTVKMPVVVSYAGNEAVVAFGYQEGSGGTLGSTTFFDNVTISEPTTVTEAAMLVSGYQLAPSGVYFDAELVFGGQCCYAITTFTSMDATLSMSYKLTNGDFSAPKAVYQFGSDTAEGAYGIGTSFAQGKFQVGLGTLGFASSYPVAPPVPIHLTLSYAVSDGSQLATQPDLKYVANGVELTTTIGGTPTTVDVDDSGSPWREVGCRRSHQRDSPF